MAIGTGCIYRQPVPRALNGKRTENQATLQKPAPADQIVLAQLPCSMGAIVAGTTSRHTVAPENTAKLTT
jgi:hypothetical protein